MKYDYLIVGAGWAGATIGNLLTEQGKKCLVVDKRECIGGLASTEIQDDIVVHRYGPHIFHTGSRMIWDYVNRFAEFNPIHYSVKSCSCYQGGIYSLPINLLTLFQVFGATSIERAKAAVAQDCIPTDNPQNMEEWCLANVGRTLYSMFIEGYTTKQWGVHPIFLPASIVRRLPIRYTFNDSWFNDADIYVGIPKYGYTPMFAKMLEGCTVELGIDFTQHPALAHETNRIICTMPLDRFCNCELGPLSYRSLMFEHEWMDKPAHQGTPVLNYTGLDVDYTRIIEHKFFDPYCKNTTTTLVTKEYPSSVGEPMYVLPDEYMKSLAMSYKTLLRKRGIYTLGRFGTYEYLDQDKVVQQAMDLLRELANG